MAGFVGWTGGLVAGTDVALGKTGAPVSGTPVRGVEVNRKNRRGVRVAVGVDVTVGVGVMVGVFELVGVGRVEVGKGPRSAFSVSARAVRVLFAREERLRPDTEGRLNVRT